MALLWNDWKCQSVCSCICCKHSATVLVQPFAAPIADKMKKKGIMICTDLLRGLLLSVFLLFFCLNRVSGWMFLTFTFATNLVEAFRVPAGISFVTKVLDKDELDAGINMNQTTSQICIIAGTAAGGILIAFPRFSPWRSICSLSSSRHFSSVWSACRNRLPAPCSTTPTGRI